MSDVTEDFADQDFPGGEASRRKRPKVRPSHIIFLGIAVLCTILLAYWQWTRFQSGSGSFQNLGYALQWPLFGAFFVFAYRKFLEYENKMIDAQESADDPDFLYQLDELEFATGPTEIDPNFLPERPTLDVEEFNQLNAQHRGNVDPR
ncbi:hypothetical membrane protein [Corynebacterium renale]|uniref:DNA-binding transcriptional regulator of glucitol operon n=1 Tax=Corynebacterium renale TaxID=1724 RepID=A0A2A9DQC2_9CORY|nr:hypothetical protein [Corynebacterium renale]PFG28119.1 DNA-binding transcriptional regulator of glucitol operon [Corynebacterium renale]SQG65291.1 hypothetical membrane protein [Corynebacterium renale]SQI20470.1 hypothetical membrane protein [Corynebacterium renale]STC98600.1 hypothetical membrane protein [Corynebacterium renale]